MQFYICSRRLQFDPHTETHHSCGPNLLPRDKWTGKLGQRHHANDAKTLPKTKKIQIAAFFSNLLGMISIRCPIAQKDLAKPAARP